MKIPITSTAAETGKGKIVPVNSSEASMLQQATRHCGGANFPTPSPVSAALPSKKNDSERKTHK